MKISTAGNAVILESEVSMEAMRIVKKYAPSKLKLKSEDGKEDLFVFTTGKEASITKFGICFTNENEEGKAILTMLIPTECKDKKEYIAELLMPIKELYTKLEEQIADEAEKIIAAKESLMKEIN